MIPMTSRRRGILVDKYTKVIRRIISEIGAYIVNKDAAGQVAENLP